MYIYIYICICIYIHVYVYIYLSIYLSLYIVGWLLRDEAAWLLLILLLDTDGDGGVGRYEEAWLFRISDPRVHPPPWVRVNPSVTLHPSPSVGS